ncbi:MAG TPA: hypothetical protein VFG33_30065 [Kribbella sp.]|uniref:hypothetical protein n=1 Tax=Kribbella sp. TaxID=1871183 RepID=UPI002D76662F|nr:hypothetical protein [Kribbella sp.]HET6297668.1 hypothetical protein [Kribbella sp.]
MSEVKNLQAEIARWEKDLAALEDECTAEGWTEPEKLLFTLQRTAATYRQRILPKIAADRALVLHALPDSKAAVLTAYSTIIIDELVRHVDRLEELRFELVRVGQTAQLQLQAVENLAALRALGTVLRRFGQELLSSR